MIQINPHIALGDDELELRFIRASGPGGQNVNKVSTAVQLRFDVGNSPSLPGDVRTRLIRLAGRRVTQDGILIIEARRFRTQEQNREDAVERLAELIRKAAIRPEKRKATRPTRASRERRLTDKKTQGKRKELRRRADLGEG